METTEYVLRATTAVVGGLIILALAIRTQRAWVSKAGLAHVCPGALLWFCFLFFGGTFLIALAGIGFSIVDRGMPHPNALLFLGAVLAVLAAFAWFYFRRIDHIVKLRLRFTRTEISWNEGDIKIARPLIDLKAKRNLLRGLTRCSFPDGTGFTIDQHASGLQSLIDMAEYLRDDYLYSLSDEEDEEEFYPRNAIPVDRGGDAPDTGAEDWADIPMKRKPRTIN